MMKKTLTLLIVMTTVACASAQITIIPKIGITLSKVVVGDDDEQDAMKSKPGVSLGAAFNVEVNEMLSVQPEVQFVQKGFRLDESFSASGYSEKIEGKVSINYLEIPVLLKTSFGNENFKFFLNGGPSLGIGLGGNGSVTITVTEAGVTDSGTLKGKVKFGPEPDDNEDEDIYFDNRLDFGVQFGGGMLIGNKIMIDFRYGVGLSNLYKKEEGMSNADAKSKNRVLQFTVGMPLPMK